ncbi:MAG: DoxX family protein [Bacteroidota bacterium]
MSEPGLSSRLRLLYWVLTGLVAAAMTASGGLYFRDVFAGSGEVLDNFAELGYPSYMVAMLGTAKLLGALALVVRRFPLLTEWAYAGFTFNFLSAGISHLTVGHTLGESMPPFVMLAILLGSYTLWRRQYRVQAV